MNDITQIASFAATAVSLAGNILVNQRKRGGFLVWIASNVMWAGIGFCAPTVNWGQMTLWLTYTALSLHGWMSWRRAAEEAKAEAAD